MVLPEGAPDSGRSRPRRRSSIIFGVAALALAFGAIALGALTAPQSAPVPETTATASTNEIERPIDLENFTVADIERGDPFTWSRVHSVGGGYPLALFEHDGWIYSFATATSDSFGRGGGALRAWRSRDGTKWESLGQVIEQGRSIAIVTSTGRELIAVEGGLPGAGLTVWRSVDAIEWDPDVIEMDGLTENMTVYPQAVGANNGILVVAARQELDLSRLIQETVTDDLGYAASSPRYGWWPEFSGDEVEVVIGGPLGFPLVRIPVPDLGLTDQETVLFRRNYETGREPDIDVWVLTEDSEWLPAEIPGAFLINSMTTTPTGELLASGWGSGGRRLWTSLDGFNWEERSPTSGPEQIQYWNGQLIGPSRTGRAAVVTSEDGVTWESIGPVDLFPGLMSWHFDALASGPGGIAATVEAFPNTPESPTEETITLVDGDATLTIDYSTGLYRVETEGSSHVWSMASSRTPDGVRVDPSSARVIFFDTDTDEDLASFSFSELIEAEESWMVQRFPQVRHEAFVFYGEDESWTIQDAPMLEDTSIHTFVVTESHVVAALVASESIFETTPSPGFEIWSAPIP